MPEFLDGMPWTWVLIRATGVGAWLALTAVVAWGLAVRAVKAAGRPFSRALSLHRWLGTIALVLVVVHMALLLIDTYVPFTLAEILVPFAAPWKPLAVALGTIAFWLMVPAWLLGRMRRRWGDHWFLRVHALAYAAWPLATAHYVLAGTDALAVWSLALLVAGTAVIVVLLLARSARESESADR
jgi:sulfoxide reductase heme-binding subunit YedZ